MLAHHNPAQVFHIRQQGRCTLNHYVFFLKMLQYVPNEGAR